MRGNECAGRLASIAPVASTITTNKGGTMKTRNKRVQTIEEERKQQGQKLVSFFFFKKSVFLVGNASDGTSDVRNQMRL